MQILAKELLDLHHFILQDPQEHSMQDMTNNDMWWLDAYSLHMSQQGIVKLLHTSID